MEINTFIVIWIPNNSDSMTEPKKIRIIGKLYLISIWLHLKFMYYCLRNFVIFILWFQHPCKEIVCFELCICVLNPYNYNARILRMKPRKYGFKHPIVYIHTILFFFNTQLLTYVDLFLFFSDTPVETIPEQGSTETATLILPQMQHSKQLGRRDSTDNERCYAYLCCWFHITSIRHEIAAETCKAIHREAPLLYLARSCVGT